MSHMMRQLDFFIRDESLDEIRSRVREQNCSRDWARAEMHKAFRLFALVTFAFLLIIGITVSGCNMTTDGVITIGVSHPPAAAPPVKPDANGISTPSAS